jgi:hypothetical protein
MMRSVVRLGLAALLTVLLCACGQVVRLPLAPALFPAMDTAPTRDPATIALVLDAPEQLFRSPTMRYFPVQVELPIGRIVEAAGLRALGREFVTVAPGLASPDARALRVQVSGIALDLKSELIYFIPLPYIFVERTDVTARLAFTLHVTGPDGAVRWSQAYDSGRELWVPKKPSLLVAEPAHEGVQRMAHELSLRLMRQAAQDLRVWLERERRRERVL